MPEETRRLAAILSIDAVGYSRLMADDEAGAHELFRRHRDDNLLPAIARYGGRIVNTAGDGLLIEFGSVVAAVAAALAMQDGIGRTNAALPPGKDMAFRIGINVGDVIVEGEDLFGAHVNLAARLESLAQPGDLLVSRAVREQAEGRLEAVFQPYGTHRVKNIDTPVEVFRVTRAGAPPRPLHRLSGPWRKRAAAVAGVLVVLCGAAVLASMDLLRLPFDPGFMEAARGPTQPSIAVLPFANQTGEPTNDYLTDGFTEDVISTLGRFATVTVMSRNAVAPYKGVAIRPAEVGRVLNSRYLVEGTIRQSGGQRRITAQLTEAQTGVVLWAGTFDETSDNLITVHDAIVREVAAKLAQRVVQAEGSRSAGKPTERLAAYELLLRARAELARSTRAGHVEARQMLERALALDPQYAELYVAYSQLMYERSLRGWTEQMVEGFQEAGRLAHQALTFNPGSAGAFAQLARVHVVFGRYEEALTAADRAIALNPSDPIAQYARAAVLLWLGRPDDSIAAITAMQRVEPQLGAEHLFTVGCAHLLLKSYEQAQALIESNIARFPDYAYLYVVLAAAHAAMGDTEEARAAADELKRYDPFFSLERFGSRFRRETDRERIAGLLRKAGVQ
jgi:adenylate cyclase